MRGAKEGMSTVLLQSGLEEKWCGSMECFCNLRNIEDLLSDGKTPYERRFEPFKRPMIPCVSMVEYPLSVNDLSRLGIFIGYVLYAGGILKGDSMVADIEALEEMHQKSVSGTQCKRSF